ncbi:unnamed protein product [Paramecium octaurelia]|uniref:Transmembrane protein n=1 Tax=Paramecium octaurelia TaxID=43137 RepID=A0A8S1WJ12_PAROT|nr:unnamed protein product [Paramecium octaurelia]
MAMVINIFLVYQLGVFLILNKEVDQLISGGIIKQIWKVDLMQNELTTLQIILQRYTHQTQMNLRLYQYPAQNIIIQFWRKQMKSGSVNINLRLLVGINFICIKNWFPKVLSILYG